MVAYQGKTTIQSRSSVSATAVLRQNLTEQGLKRVLTKHKINPLLLQHNTPEEAARHLQRRASGRPSPIRFAKKAVHGPIGHGVGRTKGNVAKKASKKSADVRPVKQARPVPNNKLASGTSCIFLICTNNKRYGALRKMFSKESRVSQAALVSSITAAIGSYIGAASAIIAPFVALGLMAFLQGRQERLVCWSRLTGEGELISKAKTPKKAKTVKHATKTRKAKKQKTQSKPSVTRRWEIVLSFYREDGNRGSFAINHSCETKSEALKRWKEEVPSWVTRHPNFASLRKIVYQPGKPVVMTEVDSVYSVGPFWDYGRHKREKEEEEKSSTHNA